MICDLKYEWDKLLFIKVKALKYIDIEPIKVTDLLGIWIGGRKITHGTRTIINELLLFCSNLTLILIHLECICILFQKYRVSVLLDKCEFLKGITEYVGHDITSKGNYPAQSKL